LCISTYTGDSHAFAQSATEFKGDLVKGGVAEREKCTRDCNLLRASAFKGLYQPRS